MLLPIHYQDPNHRLKGERRSKLLDSESKLYQHLEQLREKIITIYGNTIAPKRMDFHTELIRSHEEVTEELLVCRCRKLQGMSVNVNNIRNWSIQGRAIVLLTPNINGYGPTHITLAFFPDNVPTDWKINLFDYQDY